MMYLLSSTFEALKKLAPARGVASTLKRQLPYLRLARPHQYLKNLFVWIPIFFGLKLYDIDAIARTLWAFLAFCLTASIVYVLNDMIDVHDDRRHPVKKSRPLASAILGRSQAFLFISILIALDTAVCVIFLDQGILLLLVVYLVINVAYSFKLKQIAIIDLVCISTGFVLRVFTGGMAADVGISHWVILMVFLLALFLALAKRRDDLILATNGHKPRKSLDNYNLEFINAAMVAMGSVIVVSYILYTVSPEIVDKHGTKDLYLTTFWVIVGLLRYMQITFVYQRSGSPTLVILRDVFMQAVICLWMIHFFVLLYTNRN